MGNGCKWCDVLNDAHILVTHHTEKQITKHVVLSFIVSTMFRAKYKFVEP
jgi:hypothetical protein